MSTSRAYQPSNLVWDWSVAALGAVYALPAAVVALSDPQKGLALAVGALPGAQACPGASAGPDEPAYPPTRCQPRTGLARKQRPTQLSHQIASSRDRAARNAGGCAQRASGCMAPMSGDDQRGEGCEQDEEFAHLCVDCARFVGGSTLFGAIAGLLPRRRSRLAIVVLGAAIGVPKFLGGPQTATKHFNERVLETVLGVGIAYLYGLALPTLANRQRK